MKTATLITAMFFAAGLAAPLAQAHIVLAQATAPAGSFQKLTFQVGHGCEHNSATTGFTVLVPEKVVGVKPMSKEHWTVATVDGKLGEPLMMHGKAITSAVRQVSWKGGSLPDANYDEFSMLVKLPEAVGKYYFKVIQVCGKNRSEWTELPDDSGAERKFPAPMLELVPPGARAH